MDVTFKTNRLRKSIVNDKNLLVVYGLQRARKIKQRYKEMLASETLLDLSKVPAARLHPLTSDRQGQWAVTITRNERICFIIEHEPIPILEDGGVDLENVTAIKIIEIVDYH